MNLETENLRISKRYVKVKSEQLTLLLKNNFYSFELNLKASMKFGSDDPRLSTGVVIFATVIGVVAIVTCTVLNSLMSEPLFINGVNFIYSYQQAQNIGFVKVIMNLFSMLCNPAFVGLVMFLEYLITKRKLLSLIHLTYFLFAIFIIAVMKQIYQQSRPIWYSDKIQRFEWTCPHDFGHPSGHSFSVLPLYEPIFTDFLGLGKGRWMLFVLTFFAIMIPISRMYLGVHSANQITLGATLGVACIVLFRYQFQVVAYEIYWYLFTKKHIQILIAIIVTHILCLVFPVLIYEINASNRPMEANDILNLNKRCGDTKSGVQIQAKMMIACGIVNFVFGCLYGYFLLKNEEKNRLYETGRWRYKDKASAAKHIVLLIAMSGLPALLFIGVAGKVIKVSYVVYFLMTIGALLSGIGITFFSQNITKRTDWIKYYSDDSQYSDINDRRS